MGIFPKALAANTNSKKNDLKFQETTTESKIDNQNGFLGCKKHKR